MVSHHKTTCVLLAAVLSLSLTVINPTSVRHDDIVRVQFSAYNTTFYLHLEPNEDLIHPEADLGPGVSREDFKAFKGVVVQDNVHSDRKWNRAAMTTRAEKHTLEHMLYEEGVLGWARMMIEHDPQNKDAMVLRGAFMANGDTYHVTTRTHYHIQKRSDDAVPYSSPTPAGSSLIIYRDSDLYNRADTQLRRKRATDQQQGPSTTSTCGSDALMKLEDVHPLGAMATSPMSALTDHEFYYPPNLTTTIRDPSSSWTNLLTGNRLNKRAVAMGVAGPNPVPEGCPANRLITFMGVAADCTYVRSYQGAVNARKQIFADFNTASAIYESTFNVALGVITLNIVPDGCPTTPTKEAAWNRECSAGYSIDQRLNDFSSWRGQDARVKDGAGLWHLMTKCNSGPVVGIAWTKALCQAKAQEQKSKGHIEVTAGAAVSSITPNEWMVIAHEIGHNFGAMHDCMKETCTGTGTAVNCCPLSATVCDAGAKYIMNPSESVATKLFSPCSIKAICSTIASPSGQCLKPPGTRQLQNSEANICGNGIKETGEQCDCGSAEDCAKDPCCDGATCKFKGNAVCDDLNDGCCQGCQFRAAGQVCRKAISECDTEEVCTGTTGDCPEDVRVKNQTPCKGTGTYANVTGLECSNGLCTSRDLQCQQLDHAGVHQQCGHSSTCEMTCNDPKGSSMSCLSIPGVFFVDGTSCGFGGSCSSGKCEYANGFDGFLGWAKNNLLIVIPIASILGLMILCCVWSCCCGSCTNRRRQYHDQGKPYQTHQYQFAGYGPPPGQPSGQPGQQYPMEALAPPPPAYGYPAMPQAQPAYGTHHPNHSSENPFSDHHAVSMPQAPSRPQNNNPNGYI
ncbi:hypothetical protein BGZ95_001955 [Linnemannia exigua]|uniref:Disintegrin and metalloproteinase domain-containing protein B n=1 Tax=Linnemannia exigua TaxID=604196 RepID=A0AAD4D654_9FUNG|nr:hypothetical protein BGZ95_001955 [Linnemannia exigua]